MYSFSPLISDANTHFGFYLVCFAAFLCVIGLICHDVQNRDFSKFSYISCILLVLISGLISYNSGEIYENEKVEAKLVSTYEVKKEERSGKMTHTVIYPYVTYLTPEGEVSLQREPQVLYPNNVILYKNAKR